MADNAVLSKAKRVLWEKRLIARAKGERMKTIYMIGGTMGVGKTTVCRMLKAQLPSSVFLDGDWCWDMHPFVVNDETKKMVIDNICFLLGQFIRCSAYENIIFCWVMHEQSIIDSLLARLEVSQCTVKTISLICDEATLRYRLKKDIDDGIRTEDVVQRSIAYLPMYRKLDTVKIDTTGKSAEQICRELMS